MKIPNVLLACLLLFVGIGVLYSNMRQPCIEPLRYAIGGLDSRFGLTEPEFVKVLNEGESVWESAAGRELFLYDPEADFKVNLVYDERQERTEEYERIKGDLEESENEFKSIEEEYNSLLARYDEKLAVYESATAEFESDLAEYNSRVDYWNGQGGAPEKEYNELTKTEEDLGRRADKLEADREELNRLSRRINTIVEEGNNLAEDYNSAVLTYNQKFGTTTEFDQGDYRGSEINIYQFKELSDLSMVVAHEFGHALGLDHVENPRSVMYHFMGDQDLNALALTESDKSALFTQCKIGQ